ncbi:hypothetical protein DDF62_03415 [Caulobacter radicis]|uniref:hypothetical protein n=1 Tax=Caulobacter radicis TaxID=2172650 RepID=UPI000D576A1D|nr:hypothetical protein [Caulobacter radicis]PVM92212.1 hypothetical protein DDF62_03415 [Caulobacter radicis]
MKKIVLLALFGLTACDQASNRFEVRVAGGEANGAELRLCGERIPLARSGDRFSGVQSAKCEGAGEILVSFSGGKAASCGIGYVTPGLEQAFGFVVRDGACEAVG